ncbi:MAG: RNA 2'-phosphotransferase [Kiloniellales bacterium]
MSNPTENPSTSKVEMENISRFLSHLLRHSPSSYNIELDSGGWAPIGDVIRNAPFHVTYEKIAATVASSSKSRFAVSEDGRLIRANYGHSVNVDLDLKPEAPPNILYHGTASKSVDSILRHGINHQKRIFVHLSAAENTALKVGKRHGNPIILIVQAGAMYEDGYFFYERQHGIWLTKHVPNKYIVQTQQPKTD